MRRKMRMMKMVIITVVEVGTGIKVGEIGGSRVAGIKIKEDKVMGIGVEDKANGEVKEGTGVKDRKAPGLKDKEITAKEVGTRVNKGIGNKVRGTGIKVKVVAGIKVDGTRVRGTGLKEIKVGVIGPVLGTNKEMVEILAQRMKKKQMP